MVFLFILLAWYLIGMLSIIVYMYYDSGKILVRDVLCPEFFGFSALGPIVTAICLCSLIGDKIDSISNKHGDIDLTFLFHMPIKGIVFLFKIPIRLVTLPYAMYRYAMCRRQTSKENKDDGLDRSTCSETS